MLLHIAGRHASVASLLQESCSRESTPIRLLATYVDDSEDDKDEADFVIEDSDHAHHEALVSYSVGVSFGRWAGRVTRQA